jgi:regulator of RNase E activity RraA
MKPVVKPEDKDVERLSNLPIAVISDAMDKLGLGSSALDPAICRRTGAKIAGRARTIDRAVKPANITQQEVDADLLSAPQKLIDEANSGDVIMMAIRGDVSVAVIGDNMSTRALCRGVAGVVIDGAMRDVDAIREMGLGVYARSLGCRSALGRLVTMGLNTPIICGGVWVRPGDVVIGDADGVIVIPQARAAEVADLAEKLEVAENQSKTFIEAGNSLVDAVKKYKVT